MKKQTQCKQCPQCQQMINERKLQTHMEQRCVALPYAVRQAWHEKRRREREEREALSHEQRMKKIERVLRDYWDAIRGLPRRTSKAAEEAAKHSVMTSITHTNKRGWKPGRCVDCGRPAIAGEDRCYSCNCD